MADRGWLFAGGGRPGAHPAGAREFSLGAVAGGYFLSREARDVLFSAGDVVVIERAAVGDFVCSEPVEEIIPKTINHEGH